jgi:septal ring-binding cell division protein DamX
VADRKVLVLTHGVSQALVLSARNLPRVDVLTYTDASAYDVIWSDVVVVEEGALGGVEPELPVRVFVPAPRTEKHTASPRVKAVKAANPAKAAKPAKAEKKAAKPAKAEKKTAAKKPAAKAAPKAKAAKKPAAKKAAPKKKGGK